MTTPPKRRDQHEPLTDEHNALIRLLAQIAVEEFLREQSQPKDDMSLTHNALDCKPARVPVITENIPEALKQRVQWVNWRWRWDREQEKWTKPPIRPRGNECEQHRSNDLDHF